MSSQKAKETTKSKQPVSNSNKTDASQNSTVPAEESQERMVEQFERELIWCVEQLQLGLETQNPDSRQAKEATKVLKILLSSKAPMIKKRQAMRNTFGDYRKTMADQEKKSAAAVKKIKLSSVQQTGVQKSLFFRKSASKTPGTQTTIQETGNQSNCANSNSETMANSSETDLNSSFKFNFSIQERKASDSPIEMHDGTSSQVGNGSESRTSDTCTAGCGDVNSLGFSKTENTFRFNFVTPTDNQ